MINQSSNFFIKRVNALCAALFILLLSSLNCHAGNDISPLMESVVMEINQSVGTDPFLERALWDGKMITVVVAPDALADIPAAAVKSEEFKQMLLWQTFGDTDSDMRMKFAGILNLLDKLGVGFQLQFSVDGNDINLPLTGRDLSTD